MAGQHNGATKRARSIFASLLPRINIFSAARLKCTSAYARSRGSISRYLPFHGVLTFSVILRSVAPELKTEGCPGSISYTWDLPTRKKPLASREYPTFIKISHPPLHHGITQPETICPGRGRNVFTTRN